MMGRPEDLDNDDGESMVGKNPETALQCLSLSSPTGMTSCVRNDRCRVTPSGILSLCAKRVKCVPLKDTKFLRVAAQVHGNGNIIILIHTEIGNRIQQCIKILYMIHTRLVRCIQIRSKDLHVKT